MRTTLVATAPPALERDEATLQLRSAAGWWCLVDGSTAGLAVKDTIIVKVAGKDGSGAVKEKRSEVEEILSEHEALLTTPLWDAAEFEQAEESVEYTVTKTSGKAEMHQACDDLNEIIKTSLERVTVNAPDHETLKDVWTARSLYKPSHQKLTPAQTTELTRRMLQAYELASQTGQRPPTPHNPHGLECAF